ncbi:hypothetical protein P154DRAFT_530508 [Amniculicola lignicola CBS 123094]|uniref:RING-type domain-containing protein n=1 Tax=Amniculicola lignicola CBS 123094 TaxID=1392246 RepID=A0A6A5WXH9_9PLEO|nr:hypothetical protein P154DRAFT_530508 [Amniculicola lignicola CBS 123094]
MNSALFKFPYQQQVEVTPLYPRGLPQFEDFLENHLSASKPPPDEANCPICLSAWDEEGSSKHVVCTPCKHVFDEECLLGWLRPNPTSRPEDLCPFCRQILFDKLNKHAKAELRRQTLYVAQKLLRFIIASSVSRVVASQSHQNGAVMDHIQEIIDRVHTHSHWRMVWNQIDMTYTPGLSFSREYIEWAVLETIMRPNEGESHHYAPMWYQSVAYRPPFKAFAARIDFIDILSLWQDRLHYDAFGSRGWETTYSMNRFLPRNPIFGRARTWTSALHSQNGTVQVQDEPKTCNLRNYELAMRRFLSGRFVPDLDARSVVEHSDVELTTTMFWKGKGKYQTLVLVFEYDAPMEDYFCPELFNLPNKVE